MQTVEVRKWDDVAWSENQEKVPADRTARLALDNTEVSVDLTEANYVRLCKAVSPFLTAGRKEPKGSRPGRTAQVSRATPVTPEMRRWCEENGYPASVKGYIKVAGREAYLAWLSGQALPAGDAAKV